jgi:hypothetical protein
MRMDQVKWVYARQKGHIKKQFSGKEKKLGGWVGLCISIF